MGHVSPPEGSSAEAAARPGLPLGLPTYLAALQARFGVTPAMVKGAGWSIGGVHLYRVRYVSRLQAACHAGPVNQKENPRADRFRTPSARFA